jgi:hypothetical protein
VVCELALHLRHDLAARRDGAPVNNAQPVVTKSYGSPEAAAAGFVDGLVTTMSSADITPVAETLSNDDGTLLATYPSLFTRGRGKPTQVVGSPKFTATTTGDTARVTIDDLEVVNEESGKQATIHGGCITTGSNTKCAHGSRKGALLLGPLQHGVIATRDGTGWHIDPFASYFVSFADSIGNASQDAVASILANQLHLPEAYLRLQAQATLSSNQSTNVTLNELGAPAAARGMAVLDLPVHAGGTVNLRTDTGASGGMSYLECTVVGKSGTVAHSDFEDTLSFTAPDTETLKVVIWGDPGESVAVTAGIN